MSTDSVLNEVFAERQRQHALWGQQDLPDGTGGPTRELNEHLAKRDCEHAVATGTLTYGHVVTEEYAEAMACDDVEHLREELIQLAASAVGWVECIDRRAKL